MPDLQKRPHVTLISHSPVVYWWPAIVASYVAGVVSVMAGDATDGAWGSQVHPSNNVGLIFIATLMLLLIFTNAKLRGIYSILVIAIVAFVVVLFAWLGWWDDIFEFVPQLSAKANAGFYFLFGTLLLTAWLSAVLFFDRLVFWRIYPGQIVEERLIGGASNSHDAERLMFEKLDRDWFKHGLLGLGAGDVRMSSPGTDPVYIPNIFFVESKTRRAQALISVKPDQAEATELVMPEKLEANDDAARRA